MENVLLSRFLWHSYLNHPGLARSRPVHLSDGRCNSSSAEAGGLLSITGHGPTPPAGSTHYHWQRQAPTIILPTKEGRPLLLIRRLLIYVLVLPPPVGRFPWYTNTQELKNVMRSFCL
ncbi:hypothetical protein AVEN_49404-1 [Araneus ventricosus]|uniref:Uncharacterized protein n=1 Tax=Araneus ventricosus TaxID=182803 RepID=A0A4Y2CRV8_ARAVE|nr:hypothetical protein AVEN_49404-1 [Araneus ventricosus]